MTDKILNDLKVAAEKHFSDSLKYCLVFGSRARKEQRKDSDIDLMCVFHKSAPLQEVTSFKKWFVKYHNENGLVPDLQYAGEYISWLELQKSIRGYGHIKTDDSVIVDQIGPLDWSGFNQYRQWLCALAGPNQMLIGDMKEFELDRVQAFSTVVLLLLLSTNSDQFTKEKIINLLLNSGKESLGFVNSKETSNYIENIFGTVTNQLVSKRILSVEENWLFIDRTKAFLELPELTSKRIFDIKNKFLGKTTTQSSTEALYRALEMGVEFIVNPEKVIDYKTEEELIGGFDEPAPELGKEMGIILKEYTNKIYSSSIHQAHPNYLAFPDAGNSIAALSASILENFTNQNLIATTKSGPSATFAEIQVIKWLRELIGYDVKSGFPKRAQEAGGIMTTGGTLANATALLAARCKSFPDSRKSGLNASKLKPILIVASETFYHYSHIASFWWLGMGEDNIVYVNNSEDYRIDCDDLVEKINQYDNGVTSKVVAVVSQAGDSRTTTIEDFNKIADICETKRVWLHVDACHGGVLIFSNNHRERIKGIERADSISIDPHKGLCIPYSASAVLFKDIENTDLFSKSTDITIKKDSFDLGQITPFMGSRPFDSLKLWFFIKHLGTKGIGELVDYRYELAKSWHKSVETSKYFCTLNEVELNSVVFSVSTHKIDLGSTEKSKVISDLNKMIHDEIYQDGIICIHTFDIFDVKRLLTDKRDRFRVLGVTLGNPHTESSSFTEIFQYIDSVAEKFIKQLKVATE